MKLLHAIRTIRLPIRTTVAVLAVAAVPAGAVAVPAVASVNCQTRWGSLPEANNRVSAATLAAVRTGRQACFDRVVFDLAGQPTGYSARYVSNVFRPGAGHLMPLRGGAKLEIMVGAREFDDAGHWAFQPDNWEELSNVTGYRTLRQVAYAGSRESEAVIGIGVRARLPFRVFTLTGPGSGSRIVVDVAHRW